MKAMHKHVRVTWNSRIEMYREYLPDHCWSYPSSLPSLGSCLHGSPSVRPYPATKTLQLLLRHAVCPRQLRPHAIRKLLPGPCWDLRTVVKNQPFQLCRVAQRLKQTCGSICSLGVVVEAPAVFCQNQSVENTLGLRQVQVQSILNPSRSTPTHTTTSHTEENKKTFNQFFLRGTYRNGPSSS